MLKDVRRDGSAKKRNKIITWVVHSEQLIMNHPYILACVRKSPTPFYSRGPARLSPTFL